MNSIQRYEITTRKVTIEQGNFKHAITDSELAASVLRELLALEAQEVFGALLLNASNRILGYHEVARGGIDSCQVDARVLFRAALLVGASSVIVAHNHPSGQVEPSSEDIRLTMRLVAAGNMIGIRVLDHIIVSDNPVTYSFASHRPSLFLSNKQELP